MQANEDNIVSINIIVHIRDNHTGKVRILRDQGRYNVTQNHFEEFIWSQGNFSCDCNRARMFHADHNYDSNCNCSDGQYSINIYSDYSATRLYQEFNPNKVKHGMYQHEDV